MMSDIRRFAVSTVWGKVAVTAVSTADCHWPNPAVRKNRHAPATNTGNQSHISSAAKGRFEGNEEFAIQTNDMYAG